MSLTELWQSSQDQLKQKHIQQIIAIAGDGRLRDGSNTSIEFRGFLSEVSSELILRYAHECLSDRFDDSGLALQDVVNEIGVRLGFEVTAGRYRGSAGHVGFDGLWRLPAGQVIVIEVKTTDAYRIDLDKIASYRKALEGEGAVTKEHSSILIIVGRQETGDLEAQIRGSRHAWDVRLVSVDALLRLMALKEEVEDPQIIRRIHQILVPREFTRVDEIAEVLFSTAKDIKQEEEQQEGEVSGKRPKFTPVAFHGACVERIEKVLGKKLVKRTRATFSSADDSIRLVCAVSKEHSQGSRPYYWFAFHPHQRDFLACSKASYASFGCGSEKNVLLIPFGEFNPWTDGMGTTQSEDQMYWHVVISRENGQYVLHRKKGEAKVELTSYLLA